MNYTLDDVTLLILAGGRGRRLNGQDKGLIKLADKFLIEYILQTASPCIGNILISANRNQQQYSEFGFGVVSDSELGDTVPEFSGPLAGMLTGMHNCQTALLATLPCDTPLIGSEYFDRMLASLNQATTETTITSTTTCVAFSGDHMQPLHNLAHVDNRDNLAAALLGGTRRVREWITALEPTSCRFNDTDKRFTNINTPAELEAMVNDIQAAQS